jgi:hypothetical protein
MLLTRNSPVPPAADRPALVLDESGTWRHPESGVAAVARHRRLAEVVKPRVVARDGNAPEGVLFSLSEIVADARLNFAMQAGERLDGGDEPRFLVSWDVWLEHADEPAEAWLPEHDAAPGIDRYLAATERRWRFAKKALDDAGTDRTWAILIATRLGRSRRDVSETIGLSSGRIQQLNEDPPPELRRALDRFVDDAAEVVELVSSESHRSRGFDAPREIGSDRFDELVREMLALGLLEETSGRVAVTEDGRSLAAAQLTRRGRGRAARRHGVGRERAGDASG